MDRPFTFAQRLQTLIDEKHVTKSELARSCGIDKSNVTRYLSGTYEAKQDVVYRISQRYGVSASWLMGYDTPMVDDGLLDEQRTEINEIFERMPPELRTHALALLKGLVPPEQSPGDR